MSRDEDDFLGRWSARKLKARTEPEAEPAPPAQAPAEAAPVEPEKTDEEILRELGLPDPDTLVKGDDFSAFLKASVPMRLRNRALRRLWLSDPVLANLDGLNDYEEDFTDAATVVKGMKTAYKVGRGFLRDPEPEAAPETAIAEADGPGGGAAAAPGGDGARDAGDVGEAGSAGGEAADSAAPPEEDIPVAAAADDAGESAGEVAGGPAEATDDMPLRPRRMRFRFANG